MSTIDLRKKGHLEDNLKLKFHEVLRESVAPFHEYVENISKGISEDIDWWVSTPVSRDTLYSNLFHNFTILYFLKKLLNEKIRIDTIIIDDIYLEEVIDELFLLNNQKVCIQVEDHKQYQRSLVRHFYEIIRLHFIFFIKLFICKFILRNKDKKYSVSDDLILIDTFFLEAFKEKERYFDGLFENLNEKEQRNTFFVPSILNEEITCLYRSIKFIRSHPNKYLLKEDFLSFRDLLFTIGHFYRKNKIQFGNIKVLGCSFYKLVEAELHYLNRYFMCIEALLSYRFARILNKKQIKIRTTVNWFENQPMDKGWNLGFNSFFKDSHNLGYRGLVPANYFLSQKYVTDFEFESGVTPKELYTVGDNEGLEAKRFTKLTKVLPGPAFRFKYLWGKLSRDRKAKNKVFIALPITIDQSIVIMEAVNSIQSHLDLENIEFLIKLHPTMEESFLLSNLTFPISSNMTFTKEEASSILMKSNLIIAGMSSICLEACAAGVPLIIFNYQNLIPFNSLPNNIPKEVWKDVSNEEQLLKEVRSFLTMKDHDKKIRLEKSEMVKINNFVPVNNDSIKHFLNL